MLRFRMFAIACGYEDVQHQSQVTWDQKLLFHPHLHVVVPDAGFDVGNGEWRIRA